MENSHGMTVAKQMRKTGLEDRPMLSIGTMAKRTRTKVQTIRYYEHIGLMPEPGRTEGGQRRYGQAELDRLAFIRHSRELGFSLEAIRELLDLSDNPERPCTQIDAVAQRQLKEVEARIARLQSLETELRRMIGECHSNRVADCRILEVLRDHEECLSDHNRPDLRKKLSENSATAEPQAPQRRV